MKIVCKNCQAKYLIADGKVAGKRVKIKCKKCGEVVEFEGPALAHSVPLGPAPVPFHELAAMAAAEELNIGIDGVPTGPIKLADLPALVAAQKVSEESFVWIEGFADWRLLHAFPGLMAILRSAKVVERAPRAEESEPGPQAAGDPAFRPLAEAVARGGAALLADRGRLEEVLRGAYASERRHLPLLLVAYDEGVVTELLSVDGAAAEAQVRRLVAGLVAATGLQEEPAWWAVRAWAAALRGA